jgi:hypothetical protein
MVDIFDFVPFDNDNDEYSCNATPPQSMHIQPIQPVINISNSSVTINNTSRGIIYDNNDNYEFIFEEPEGIYGAPPPAGDDIENDINLEFDDIIES